MSTLSIDKSKTALVVIDLQKGIAGRPVAPHDGATVIKNAAALADAFRANSMPVFLVCVTPSPDGKECVTSDHRRRAVGANSRAGLAEIVPEMGPKPGDFVITKHQWGAFVRHGA